MLLVILILAFCVKLIKRDPIVKIEEAEHVFLTMKSIDAVSMFAWRVRSESSFRNLDTIYLEVCERNPQIFERCLRTSFFERLIGVFYVFLKNSWYLSTLVALSSNLVLQA